MDDERAFIIESDPPAPDGFADFADNYADACLCADRWARDFPGTTVTVIDDDDLYVRVLYAAHVEP